MILEKIARTDLLQLEQTGRIFKSAHESNRSATLARASRLKQTLPVANVRFHEALDTLEQELVSTSRLIYSISQLTRSSNPHEQY